jgi:hypothetical protein
MTSPGSCTPASEAHGIAAENGGAGVRDEPLAFDAQEERLQARIELVS